MEGFSSKNWGFHPVLHPCYTPYEPTSVMECTMLAHRASAQCPGNCETWSHQIEAARHGSSSALGQLLNSCEPTLFAFASKSLNPRIRSKFDTSDLVQEAFLDAHRRFDTFHGETREQLLAWLRRILINNMLNLSRGYATTSKRSVDRERPLTGQVSGAVVADGNCPVKEVQDREEFDRVSACLAELPEHYQQVILLRFHDSLSFAEIGHIMNRSEDAAQKLWDRALALLRKKLGI